MTEIFNIKGSEFWIAERGIVTFSRPGKNRVSGPYTQFSLFRRDGGRHSYSRKVGTFHIKGDFPSERQCVNRALKTMREGEQPNRSEAGTEA